MTALRSLLIKSRNLKLKTSKGTTPPLGLMYLAAYLRKHMTVDVRIIDVQLMTDPIGEIQRAVATFNPDLVGISALTCEARLMHEAARLVKLHDPACPVIVGGPHASSDPTSVLRDGHVDVAVMGEGEETFLELAELIRDEENEWKDPGNLKCISGIAYREQEGQTTTTPPRPFIEDLDSLPFPAWDLVDIRRFWKLRSMSSLRIKPYMTAFTSRGCPFQCTYCHQIFGRRFRYRSWENVVEEAGELRKRYGIEDLEIIDDIANFNSKRINLIFEGLLDKNLRLMTHFPNGIRMDVLREDTVKLLRRIGAGEVSVAVETASPRLQKLTKKNLNLDKVWNNIELLAKNRIPTRGFFMMGFPTETREELLSTINFACKSKLHVAMFFIVNPYPNTEMYRLFEAHNKLPVGVSDGEYEYFGSPFNGSEVPDAQFQWLVKYAYFRFFSNPLRIYRLLRDRPYYRDLPSRFHTLVVDAASFRKIAD